MGVSNHPQRHETDKDSKSEEMSQEIKLGFHVNSKLFVWGLKAGRSSDNSSRGTAH